MKEIPLTRGLVTFVDDDDYEYLAQWKWHAAKGNSTFYAVRNLWTGKRKNRKCITICMHRLILGLKNPKQFTDHIDHNGLNNQKSNLRVCTPAQNSRNTSKRVTKNNSKYLGTFYRKKVSSGSKKWMATIQHDNKNYHLGHFNTEEEAAIAYNKKAIELHGEFANVNQVQL